jgi:mRNA interferase MazF
VGLALLCPITSKIKGYPFEVEMPDSLQVTGAILADQVKSLDWRVRQAHFACKAPAEVVAEVQAKIQVLIF